MKQYVTVSLKVLPGHRIEVYDFHKQELTVLEKTSLGEAIEKYNQAGFFVCAVDRVSADPLREERLVMMTKEV